MFNITTAATAWIRRRIQSISLLVIYIRKLVKEVSKKGKAMRAIRAMRTMRARRKMRVIRKTLSSISLSTIDCNSTPCQALQYLKYYLVEPVRSFKWAIGWLQSPNL